MLGPCDKQNFKHFLGLVELVKVDTTIFDQIFVRFPVRKSDIIPYRFVNVWHDYFLLLMGLKEILES